MSDDITLADWLKSNNCSKQELGRRVGCNGVHIGRIMRGSPSISQVLALKIFDVTGVRVGPLVGMANPEIAVVRRLNQPSGAAA